MSNAVIFMYSMKKLMFLMVVTIVLFDACSCTVSDDFDHAEFVELKIRCRVLGALKFEVIPFAAGPLFSSYVMIQIVAPESLCGGDERLILWSGPMNQYNGPDGDSIWREVGSVVDVTVLRNKFTGEYYLYPKASPSDFVDPIIYELEPVEGAEN